MVNCIHNYLRNIGKNLIVELVKVFLHVLNLGIKCNIEKKRIRKQNQNDLKIIGTKKETSKNQNLLDLE